MITNITRPQFDIPGEIRVVAQRSIAQAKLAFDSYMRLTWDASSTFQSERRQVGVEKVRNQMMNFILRNITLRFEFCEQFVQVKDADELLRLLNDFSQSQMQIMSEQIRDQGLALSRVAIDSPKNSKESELAA